MRGMNVSKKRAISTLGTQFMRRGQLAMIALSLLLFVLACESRHRATSTISSPLVGRTAPDIAGDDGDGNFFRLSDYRGKVVLLDFWATW
jgi:hypothetical protein